MGNRRFNALKGFDLGQGLGLLLGELLQFVEAGPIPYPARRLTVAHRIRLFASQICGWRVRGP